MNGSSNDLEPLARAFAARDASPAALSQCPDPELLFEAASGHLEQEQRLKIVDHVSLCAECSQAWRLAMELGARPAGDVAESQRTSIFRTARMGPARTFGIPRFALAASLIAAVGIAAYLSIPGLEQRPQYREVANPLAPTSLVASRLTRARFLLRWSPGPAGSTYTLRLSTTDLAPLLFKEGLTTTELLVPGPVLAKVASGEELLWQVEVRLPNGRRVASDTYTVTLD